MSAMQAKMTGECIPFEATICDAHSERFNQATSPPQVPTVSPSLPCSETLASQEPWTA